MRDERLDMVICKYSVGLSFLTVGDQTQGLTLFY